VASGGDLNFRDECGFGGTMQRTVTQVGTDAVSRYLEERQHKLDNDNQNADWTSIGQSGR